MYNVILDLDGLKVKVGGTNRRDAYSKAVKLYKHSMRMTRISNECRMMVENYLVEDVGR